MTKYFLKKTGEEINLGDTIEIATRTYFRGEGIVSVKITITETVLPQLIKDGFIEVKSDSNSKVEIPVIVMSLYKEVAKTAGINVFKVMRFFSLLKELSKSAYLAALIEIVAKKKNAGKKFGDRVYWLMPSIGYKPFPITGTIPKGVTVFTNAADAFDAYNLLEPVIKGILNEK
jgi:hypothetical protein